MLRPLNRSLICTDHQGTDSRPVNQLILCVLTIRGRQSTSSPVAMTCTDHQGIGRLACCWDPADRDWARGSRCALEPTHNLSSAGQPPASLPGPDHTPVGSLSLSCTLSQSGTLWGMSECRFWLDPEGQAEGPHWCTNSCTGPLVHT